MRYRLVALDCDGVLVDTVSSWQWIHDHFGVSNEDALHAYFRNEIDGWEFMRRDIALWKGIDPSISHEKIRGILRGIPRMKGLTELATALREAGTEIVVISGGLDLLVDEIVDVIGARAGYSNSLEADAEGRLTGEGILRVEPRNKQGPLLHVMEEMGVRRKEVVAVGDTKGDTSMFTVCDLGVAFNPQDDVIRARADIVVEEKDLTKLKDLLI